MYILQPTTGGLGWRVRPRTAVAVATVHVLAAMHILGLVALGTVAICAACVVAMVTAAVVLAAPHTPTADDTMEDRT